MATTRYRQVQINGVDLSVLKSDGKDVDHWDQSEIMEVTTSESFLTFMPGKKQPILVTATPPSDEQLAQAIQNPGKGVHWFGRKETISLVSFGVFLISVFVFFLMID
ncbi:hypothetical protein [Reinekea blandensis]|uniref:Uncharacterized protein n=1 Tax=Reinekea blandensis MED297 TaxID=314283 RepID=A4BB53_9GAMM|nr:hypothetical protein [Reinekea blandensis]EAR10666.1 hypothetical protein MED297_11640 [Reinekea sp. MED297] [Reinekea blandensis MED297]